MELLYLLGVPLRHVRLHLPQALAHPQDPIDQHPVGGPLDLEVAEESVGAEKSKGFIEDIVVLGVGLNVEVGDAGGKGGEGVGGTAGAGAEREERKVACRS